MLVSESLCDVLDGKNFRIIIKYVMYFPDQEDNLLDTVFYNLSCTLKYLFARAWIWSSFSGVCSSFQTWLNNWTNAESPLFLKFSCSSKILPNFIHREPHTSVKRWSCFTTNRKKSPINRSNIPTNSKEFFQSFIQIIKCI